MNVNELNYIFRFRPVRFRIMQVDKRIRKFIYRSYRLFIKYNLSFLILSDTVTLFKCYHVVIQFLLFTGGCHIAQKGSHDLSCLPTQIQQ